MKFRTEKDISRFKLDLGEVDRMIALQIYAPKTKFMLIGLFKEKKSTSRSNYDNFLRSTEQLLFFISNGEICKQVVGGAE